MIYFFIIYIQKIVSHNLIYTNIKFYNSYTSFELNENINNADNIFNKNLVKFNSINVDSIKALY